MGLNLRDSVVVITGSDSRHFGTGFVIHRERNVTYILTCMHVVTTVGADALQVESYPAQVVASDVEEDFDLAVLRVEAQLVDFPMFQLKAGGIQSAAVITAGCYDYGKNRIIQQLTGTLDETVIIPSANLGKRSTGWHLNITNDDATLQPGYSGAPIVDSNSGYVLGVVNQRKDLGKKGLVISIEALEMLWPEMPPQLLQKQISPMATVCSPQVEPRMNLDDELAAFKRIATGKDTETRLILVHGASGMGKSYLLSLYREIANNHHLESLDIPLGPQIKVVDCLETMVGHYGWQHFPGYDEVATKGAPDPLTRPKEEQWWRTLTRKFFIDLESYIEASPLVIFFDPYEKADYTFQNWVSSIFLPRISVHCSITVIIAGQETVTPMPTSRTCRNFPLNGVTADWYHRYVEARNAPIDSGLVDEFHRLLGGEPKRFVDYVNAQLSPGGVG